MGRKNKQPAMSFDDAMEMAEDMDLPDGAFWAMAHELSGMEYGDGFDLLAEEATIGHVSHSPNPSKPKNTMCEKCGKMFVGSGSMKQHSRDKHGSDLV